MKKKLAAQKITQTHTDTKRNIGEAHFFPRGYLGWPCSQAVGRAVSTIHTNTWRWAPAPLRCETQTAESGARGCVPEAASGVLFLVAAYVCVHYSAPFMVLELRRVAWTHLHFLQYKEPKMTQSRIFPHTHDWLRFFYYRGFREFILYPDAWWRAATRAIKVGVESDTRGANCFEWV